MLFYGYVDGDGSIVGRLVLLVTVVLVVVVVVVLLVTVVLVVVMLVVVVLVVAVVLVVVMLMLIVVIMASLFVRRGVSLAITTYSITNTITNVFTTAADTKPPFVNSTGKNGQFKSILHLYILCSSLTKLTHFMRKYSRYSIVTLLVVLHVILHLIPHLALHVILHLIVRVALIVTLLVILHVILVFAVVVILHVTITNIPCRHAHALREKKCEDDPEDMTQNFMVHMVMVVMVMMVMVAVMVMVMVTVMVMMTVAVVMMMVMVVVVVVLLVLVVVPSMFTITLIAIMVAMLIVRLVPVLKCTYVSSLIATPSPAHQNIQSRIDYSYICPIFVDRSIAITGTFTILLTEACVTTHITIYNHSTSNFTPSLTPTRLIPRSIRGF